MKGLSLIAILIAAAVVAYLQLKGSQSSLESERAEAQDKMEQVKQDIDKATKHHMDRLKEHQP